MIRSISSLFRFLVLCSNGRVLKGSHLSFIVPVVERQLAYVGSVFVAEDTVLPKFGAHQKYDDDVMPPSWSAAQRSVRRLVCCSL